MRTKFSNFKNDWFTEDYLDFVIDSKAITIIYKVVLDILSYGKVSYKGGSSTWFECSMK